MIWEPNSQSWTSPYFILYTKTCTQLNNPCTISKPIVICLTNLSKPSQGSNDLTSAMLPTWSEILGKLVNAMQDPSSVKIMFRIVSFYPVMQEVYVSSYVSCVRKLLFN